MIPRCVCGHTDQSHYDEAGEWTYCWDCFVEYDHDMVGACTHFIPRVPGWDYVRT